MRPMVEKLFLQLNMPTEDVPLGDRERIEAALAVCGIEPVVFPLSVLRTLYPMCRDCGYDITVTLVYRQTEWVVFAVEPGDTTSMHYSLAVDYGSTTIVMELIDLRSGAVIGQEKIFNRQSRFGTDILTRITYTMESPEARDLLQRETVKTFEELLDRLTEQTGIDARACPMMVLSGNTTMIHFLLGLDAWTVFASPYAPVTSAPGQFKGSDLGMGFAGYISIIPAASNYVGGDIVSGLLALKMHEQEEASLFFDIGTNGELVIGNRHWMIAGAGAAGPALEGYISRYGMRAARGAVDRVSIEKDELSFTTIGSEKPLGICGSGIIDLLAGMLKNGWINMAGDLEPSASDRIIYLPEERQYAAVYATAEESGTGTPLFFTQTDIKQYMDTKAAAYTMIDCLLETAGIGAEDLAHCHLSGAFSAHSDLENAITIGMFPDIPRDRYRCISNTSLEGARLTLLDRNKLQEAAELAGKIYCVQFASIPDFLIRMQAARFLPHTDLERFPTVKNSLHRP
ncbi:MAG: DUF4445 domain-containing protein [Oscillospiraceae bacterium]|nr:DUF4445 domain-containing protein [Oscillospiraceae bacterium]